jgi:hypothetical protein
VIVVRHASSSTRPPTARHHLARLVIEIDVTERLSAVIPEVKHASCSSTDHGGGKRAVTQRPVPLVTFRDLNVREIGEG